MSSFSSSRGKTTTSRSSSTTRTPGSSTSSSSTTGGGTTTRQKQPDREETKTESFSGNYRDSEKGQTQRHQGQGGGDSYSMYTPSFGQGDGAGSWDQTQMGQTFTGTKTSTPTGFNLDAYNTPPVSTASYKPGKSSSSPAASASYAKPQAFDAQGNKTKDSAIRAYNTRNSPHVSTSSYTSGNSIDGYKTVNNTHHTPAGSHTPQTTSKTSYSNPSMTAGLSIAPGTNPEYAKKATEDWIRDFNSPASSDGGIWAGGDMDSHYRLNPRIQDPRQQSGGGIWAGGDEDSHYRLNPRIQDPRQQSGDVMEYYGGFERGEYFDESTGKYTGEPNFKQPEYAPLTMAPGTDPDYAKHATDNWHRYFNRDGNQGSSTSHQGHDLGNDAMQFNHQTGQWEQSQPNQRSMNPPSNIPEAWDPTADWDPGESVDYSRISNDELLAKIGGGRPSSGSSAYTDKAASAPLTNEFREQMISSLQAQDPRKVEDQIRILSDSGASGPGGKYSAPSPAGKEPSKMLTQQRGDMAWGVPNPAYNKWAEQNGYEVQVDGTGRITGYTDPSAQSQGDETPQQTDMNQGAPQAAGDISVEGAAAGQTEWWNQGRTVPPSVGGGRNLMEPYTGGGLTPDNPAAGSKKNPYGFTPPAPGMMHTQAMVPYYNPTTGETWTAPSGGYTAPKGWVKGEAPDVEPVQESQPSASDTANLVFYGNQMTEGAPSANSFPDVPSSTSGGVSVSSSSAPASYAQTVQSGSMASSDRQAQDYIAQMGEVINPVRPTASTVAKMPTPQTSTVESDNPINMAPARAPVRQQGAFGRGTPMNDSIDAPIYRQQSFAQNPPNQTQTVERIIDRGSPAEITSSGGAAPAAPMPMPEVFMGEGGVPTVNFAPGTLDVEALRAAYAPGTYVEQGSQMREPSAMGVGQNQVQQQMPGFYQQALQGYQGPQMTWGKEWGDFDKADDAFAQRDAFINRINQARTPYWTETARGQKADRRLNFVDLLEQSRKDVRKGFENPFAKNNLQSS